MLHMGTCLIVVLCWSGTRATNAFLNRAPNAIIVGGSSGMGKAAALETLLHGGDVLLVSRSVDKLEAARQELQREHDRQTKANDRVHDQGCPKIDIYALDITDEAAVKSFAHLTTTALWDALVVSAAGRATHGPVDSLPTEQARNMLDSKLWGAYHCAKHIAPRLQDGGAVVFVAGILNRRPGLNCAPLAMANGALEGLTRTLALEWGPRLRVNCLSPGFCDTERFNHMDGDRKAAMLKNTAASLPLQKVGSPSDMGQAIYYLMTAPFSTGVVLDVDGGHTIRQYANANSDPMRQQ